MRSPMTVRHFDIEMTYGMDHGLRACPFCNRQLVEAMGFRTRYSSTFVHDGEVPCVASGLNIIVGGDRDNSREWNTRYA